MPHHKVLASLSEPVTRLYILETRCGAYQIDLSTCLTSGPEASPLSKAITTRTTGLKSLLKKARQERETDDQQIRALEQDLISRQTLQQKLKRLQESRQLKEASLLLQQEEFRRAQQEYRAYKAALQNARQQKQRLHLMLTHTWQIFKKNLGTCFAEFPLDEGTVLLSASEVSEHVVSHHDISESESATSFSCDRSSLSRLVSTGKSWFGLTGSESQFPQTVTLELNEEDVTGWLNEQRMVANKVIKEARLVFSKSHFQWPIDEDKRFIGSAHDILNHLKQGLSPSKFGTEEALEKAIQERFQLICTTVQHAERCLELFEQIEQIAFPPKPSSNPESVQKAIAQIRTDLDAVQQKESAYKIKLDRLEGKIHQITQTLGTRSQLHGDLEATIKTSRQQIRDLNVLHTNLQTLDGRGIQVFTQYPDVSGAQETLVQTIRQHPLGPVVLQWIFGNPSTLMTSFDEILDSVWVTACTDATLMYQPEAIRTDYADKTPRHKAYTGPPQEALIAQSPFVVSQTLKAQGADIRYVIMPTTQIKEGMALQGAFPGLQFTVKREEQDWSMIEIRSRAELVQEQRLQLYNRVRNVMIALTVSVVLSIILVMLLNRD